MGWLSMIMLNKQIYPTLVHYFYSNFNFNSKSCSISSYVKRQVIEFDCEVLGQILSIPSDVDRFFSSSAVWNHPVLDYASCVRTIFENNINAIVKPDANLLSLEIRLIHHIFTFNFLSRGGHKERVSYLDVYLLRMVLLGDRINLSYLMMFYMNECF